VNAKFGGSNIPQFILVTAPGMMVLSIILFMGAVVGGHGQGGAPVQVPMYLAAYMLHMTVSAIVFLADADVALK
jgi:hypothetical protein